MHWSYFMEDFAVDIIYKHSTPSGTNGDILFINRVRLGLPPKAFVIEGDFEKKRQPNHWKSRGGTDGTEKTWSFGQWCSFPKTNGTFWKLTFPKWVWIVSQELFGVYVAVLVLGTVYLIFGFHRSSQGSNHCHEAALPHWWIPPSGRKTPIFISISLVGPTRKDPLCTSVYD